MRFSVEYVLMEHEILRRVCQDLESMGTHIYQGLYDSDHQKWDICERRGCLSQINNQWWVYYLQVLEYLCKPETLRFVDLRCITAVHVINPSKTRRCRQIFIETLYCTTRTLQVCLIACHTPSVEIAFQHFGTLDVICSGDVVTVLLVEGKLFCGGNAVSSEVPIWRNICECLGANTRPKMSSMREALRG